MKHIKKFGLVLLAAAALVVSCDNTNDSGSRKFGPDKETLTVGPEGSTEKVKIHASESWLASTEQPWILISPANGDASRDCQIRIDSTYQDLMREGEVRFTSAGETRVVKVNQMGFGKQIIIQGAKQVEGQENGIYNVALPDYAAFGTTHFEVKVTTNVDFTVQYANTTVIPDDSDEVPSETVGWLRCEDYKVNLVQSKPRTIRLRFNWEYNTKWWTQSATIKFIPKNGETLIQQDQVAVEQAKAPRITDDRAGDSIAVLAIARQLNNYGAFDASKNMQDWGDNIELYDQSSSEELKGRVKFVRFFIFDTEAGLPFEVRYLRKAEYISFYGNANSTIKDIDLGPSICELGQYGHLKKLAIVAYGIKKLPLGFEKLGATLEELDLSSERFNTIPDVLSKENFPKLKKLSFSANRSVDIYDLSNSSVEEPGLGFKTGVPRRLLEWDTLEELALSYNYFQGELDPMTGYSEVWTAEDKYPSLVGKPKVLPNCKKLAINLNRFTGKLPDWLLNHPHIKEWNVDAMVFNQEGKDTKGNKAGFTNVPDKITPPEKVE